MDFEPENPETVLEFELLNLNVVQIKGEYQFNYLEHA